MPDSAKFECGSGEFSHSGDFGDTIFSLATVKAAAAQGEPATFYLYPAPGRTTQVMTRERATVIAPLIESQPYIRRVEWRPYAGSNLDGWRDHLGPGRHRTILRAHMGTFGLNDPAAFETPWLTVAPKRVAKYVISRTPRAHGRGFPWRRVVSMIGPESVFLGLPDEYAAFVAEFGHVPFQPTANLLEAAQIVAGADCYIGVQTVVHAIAEGLGKPIVREAPHEAYMDNCQSMRANLVSVYEGEDVPPLSHVLTGSMMQLPYRRAFSANFQRPFWIGDDGWHRYNFRDIVNGDPYRLKELSRHFNPRTIADVGGFLGLVSGICAELWPNARITTFEPNREMMHVIGLNAPRATLIPAACHPTEKWLGYSRGRHWGDPGSNAALSQASWEKVPARPLADVGQVDLLKLDCEGGEWAILEGLHCRPTVIVGEWHNVGGVNGPSLLAERLPDYVLRTHRCDDYTGLFWAARDDSSAAVAWLPAGPA